MTDDGKTTTLAISTGSMIRAVLVGVCVFLLWFLHDLVLVVLTSIVIASFMDSAVPHFRKIGVNRLFGIIIIYAVSILSLAGLFYLFAPLLITEIYNFSGFISSYIPNLSWLNYFQNEAFSGAKDIVGSLSAGDFSVSGLLAISKEFITNLSG